MPPCPEGRAREWYRGADFCLIDDYVRSPTSSSGELAGSSRRTKRLRSSTAIILGVTGLVREDERRDDDSVPSGEVPSRSAIDDDLAGTGRQRDRVGLDALAVIDIPNRDLLTFDDARQIHQGLVDSDAADVVKVGRSDHRMVNLG
jgi:hypothetical protein